MTVLSCMLGLLFLYLSPGFVFIYLLSYAVLAKKYRSHGSGDQYIAKLFVASFIVRTVLLLAISLYAILSHKILHGPTYPGWAPNLIGDSAYYTVRGYWISLDWQGFILPARVIQEAYNYPYGWTGYSYILAVFYYLFGFSPISSVLINCLCSTLSGIICYLMARDHLSEKVSRLFGILVCFFPSLICWSVFNLKDSILIFLILYIFRCFMLLMKAAEFWRKIFWAIVIAISLFVLNTIRIKVMSIVIISLLSGSVAAIRVPKLLSKVLITALVFIFIFVLFNRGALYQIDTFVHAKISKILEIHQAAAVQTGANYKILDEKRYAKNDKFRPGKDPDIYYYLYPLQFAGYFEYLKIIARGWVHFMFEPFPFRYNTPLIRWAGPQMYAWYIVCLFAFWGAGILMRRRLMEFLPLLVFFILITVSCGLTMSNIGTAFRFRDMVTPIVLLWASVGFARAIGWDIIRDIK